mmetsp:Transcript_20588/g.38640  ORF Transcript_20588/g.38640 Transcript_20588/m.38640 type:complete len:207 (+) Transcript_20588:2024-2644(+)
MHVAHEGIVEVVFVVLERVRNELSHFVGRERSQRHFRALRADGLIVRRLDPGHAPRGLVSSHGAYEDQVVSLLSQAVDDLPRQRVYPLRVVERNQRQIGAFCEFNEGTDEEVGHLIKRRDLPIDGAPRLVRLLETQQSRPDNVGVFALVPDFPADPAQFGEIRNFLRRVRPHRAHRSHRPHGTHGLPRKPGRPPRCLLASERLEVS